MNPVPEEAHLACMLEIMCVHRQLVLLLALERHPGSITGAILLWALGWAGWVSENTHVTGAVQHKAASVREARKCAEELTPF